MKKQAFNPYLPTWEYVPDGEPYVFEDRLYIFGSHDQFDGKNFCQNDYTLWSAPIDDLTDWTNHGIIYRAAQDPAAKHGRFLQAPDVVRGPDGRYYLYYTLALVPYMGVAVSERVTGPYEYYGVVQRKNGSFVGGHLFDLFQFDPGLFLDDDGKIYLYTGFSPKKHGLLALTRIWYKLSGARVTELEEDMLTIRYEPKVIIPMDGKGRKAGFSGHEFYEASSMRKINGKYYFIYSSVNSYELCYAVSDRPDGGFTYGGTIIALGDIGYEGRKERDAQNFLGNTHGSLVKVRDQWYIFYHRQTNQRLFSRQGCAEKVTIRKDGTIPQVEMTSCGLNDGPLSGEGTYSAGIACVLRGKKGVVMYNSSKKTSKGYPYLTQSGEDRECDPDQYIADMTKGSLAGFKYFVFKGLSDISVTVSGEGKGKLLVSTEPDGKPVCEIPVDTGFEKRVFTGSAKKLKGTRALYFRYEGKGSINFHEFTLKR